MFEIIMLLAFIGVATSQLLPEDKHVTAVEVDVETIIQEMK